MNSQPGKLFAVPARKRILNEIHAKVLNEDTSDAISEQRKGTSTSSDADIVFRCECDAEDCPERIVMSKQEYARVHRKDMHFIVVPDHVRLDIEELLSTSAEYCVVSKVLPH